jgi:hypothetical protein
LRRVTLATSCAASFWDFYTTARGASYGAIETNGLLADQNGKPRLGLMFAVKAGFCGLAVLTQETHIFGKYRSRFADPLWTATNLSLTARFSAVALRNTRIIDQLRQQQQTPAYLAPTR